MDRVGKKEALAVPSAEAERKKKIRSQTLPSKQKILDLRTPSQSTVRLKRPSKG
jgi:hypothetical protein